MSEPTLEGIEDYNTLKGSRKKGVWTVIIVGLIIGAIFVILQNKYGVVEDSLEIQDSIKTMRIK